MNICPNCGLPLEACVCKEIKKQDQEILVKKEKRSYGKMVTIISNLDGIDVEELGKKLKNKLACGGKITKDQIELQGDHINKIKKILVEEGFNPEKIKI